MQYTTLLFLIKPETKEILLAMKKRGFGEGKLNGVGGKIEHGETPAKAIIREAKEEIGVTVAERDLEEAADLRFSFENNPEEIQCTAYITKTWVGEPVESEEMRPQWFPLDSIPYEQMWVSDRYWLPRALIGKKFSASFHFNADGTRVTSHTITEKMPRIVWRKK